MLVIFNTKVSYWKHIKNVRETRSIMEHDTKKTIIFDPRSIKQLEGDSFATAETFLRALRDFGYELAIIVGEHDTYFSPNNLVRATNARKPLLPIICIGSFDDAIVDLVDAIIPADANEQKLNEQIETVRTRREVLAKSGLVGRSQALQSIADTIFRIADTEISTLLIGESGTGKELVAKAIHENSSHAHQPFVAINTSAIPETLLESQLFGYKKGAFTGAEKDTPGFFERAQNGTLFLDEIGEMPLSIQVKLLRALETREYYPVGEIKSKTTNARFIAATNRDLRAMLQHGSFREDLYYRIAGVRVYIPPLRERRADIPVLVYYFAQLISTRANRSFAGFSDDAIEAMIDYHWPGNVRELRNFVENAVMLSGGKTVRAQDLTSYFEENKYMGKTLPTPIVEKNDVPDIYAQMLYFLKQNNELLKAISEKLTLGDTFDSNIEKKMIEANLAKFSGSKRKTAAAMGISERTLYRKIRKFGIEDVD